MDDNDDIARSIQKVHAQNLQIVDMINTHVKQSDNLKNDIYSLIGRFVSIDSFVYQFSVNQEIMNSSINLMLEFLSLKYPDFEDFLKMKINNPTTNVKKTVKKTKKKTVD